jgi:hypothetical protein
MKKFFMKVIQANVDLSVVLRDLDTQDNCDTLNVKVIEDGIARSVGQWSVTFYLKNNFLLFSTLPF